MWSFTHLRSTIFSSMFIIGKASQQKPVKVRQYQEAGVSITPTTEGNILPAQSHKQNALGLLICLFPHHVDANVKLESHSRTRRIAPHTFSMTPVTTRGAEHATSFHHQTVSTSSSSQVAFCLWYYSKLNSP
ncbi:hypothetical protein C2857_002743 [Epichloe festucae Fl1]|uniref:Uncharacterized protein n=1 Tax=Epichloe festucae (strain Fl1) TaxID=877507 RepID=A0A7U3SN55_EPIFF|nr:hypothetical protein C2857_002743 [Epichloe festucae Fl1]